MSVMDEDEDRDVCYGWEFKQSAMEFKQIAVGGNSNNLPWLGMPAGFRYRQQHAAMVGHAFAKDYYDILVSSPELLHRFYKTYSIVSRPDVTEQIPSARNVYGQMPSVISMKYFNQLITSMDYRALDVEIKTVDSQECDKNNLLVLVSGFITFENSGRRTFTQSFFLNRPLKAYFVLNDIVRYLDEEPQHQKQNPVEDAAKANPVEDAAKANPVSEQESTTVVEETAPVVEGVHDNAMHQREVSQGSASSTAERSGYSIFIDNLPVNITPDQVEEELKKFGAIKACGVRKSPGGALCLGFVEFEETASVQKAVQASCILVQGREVFLREKEARANKSLSSTPLNTAKGTGSWFFRDCFPKPC